MLTQNEITMMFQEKEFVVGLVVRPCFYEQADKQVDSFCLLLLVEAKKISLVFFQREIL